MSWALQARRKGPVLVYTRPGQSSTLLVVPQRHLEALLVEYVRHHNEARPHRGLHLDRPLLRPAASTTGEGKVIGRDVLGAILHE
jgi:hypothetical protein